MITEPGPTPLDAGPPLDVVAAFRGSSAGLTVLPGGEGRTWRTGDVILKPSADRTESIWVADVAAALPESNEFRIARPVRADDGSWIRDGWQAWYAVDGQPDERRIDDVIRAGAAFHLAVAALSRPGFLDTRDNPWTYGDRIAWDEQPITGDEAMSELLGPLRAARRPVTIDYQVVHGDLLGNVLFADALPPAIIDWAIYFRPVAWAHAVAVVDAVTWHGAELVTLDNGPRTAVPADTWTQMLIRALIFRIATTEGQLRAGVALDVADLDGVAHDYRSVVERVIRMV